LIIKELFYNEEINMNDIKECCKTCEKFYTEYGMELCKRWEEPMENTKQEKCSEYERRVDYEEV
jgi:hypothetical protein